MQGHGDAASPGGPGRVHWLVAQTPPQRPRVGDPGGGAGHLRDVRHGAAVGARHQRAHNVLAAKGCTLCWKAVDYRVTDPQLVGTDVALYAAGRLERVVMRRFGFPAFL